MAMKSEVEAQLDLSKLRYSMVWEDAYMLSEGLDIRSTDTVLSITSSGDNVLHLLLKEPKKIYAVDFSPVQNACLQLKMAAAREMTRDKALTLLGYTGTGDERLQLFSELKTLPADAKDLLSKNGTALAEGLVLSGKLEKHIDMLRANCLDVAIGRQARSAFIAARTPEERRSLLLSWDLDKLYDLHVECGKQLYGGGRDPSQFKYSTTSSTENSRTVAARIIRWYGREASFCRPNHYLSTNLLGAEAFRGEACNDLDDHLPFFLQSANFSRLKSLVDRVEVITGSIESLMTGTFTFDKANLSDIFEYMSEEAAGALIQRLADCCPLGGRIALWNFLVPRRPTEETNSKTDGKHQFEALNGLSSALVATDRVGYYGDFVVCECRRKPER